MNKLLNFEYATIHGTYWMIYASCASFASVFLLGNGYSNSEIGIIMAVANVLAVVMQPLTADLADRSKRFPIISITEIMTLMMMVFTAFMFILHGRTMALFVIYVLLLAWHTVLQPLFNSLNFKLQECGVHLNFGVCRSMGSLAYSVLCLFLGDLVERCGISILPITSEVMMVLLMISIAMTARQYHKVMKVNEKKLAEAKAKLPAEESEEINLIDFVKRNKLFFVLQIGVLLVFIENQVLNNFMLQIVTNVGGTETDMGRIFSLMAFLEIPTLFCFDWINKRFSCGFLLKVASVGFTLKIGVVFLAQSVAMIFAAQFLQLVSFALFLPAMVHYIDEIMSKGEAVKGQALYTMMITVSSVLGSLFGGVILDFSGARMLTMLSTILAAIGTVIVIVMVDKVNANLKNS
ncbi:MFS transporter [Aminicella lysinilytica]|uniref:PPP family 3-phenylpropionic acid transporter n=1 Tax=Aminicella lysinilytica TaxID=433323 RepID=A0A4R6Q243_9FIRM|nr:MFS transporter [Aminicella lysinilytica]TDP56300.1 PPP family 3-phenylpropionic acid transporter [Aminicella lysinilytica]